jgi:hypothetical protein
MQVQIRSGCGLDQFLFSVSCSFSLKCPALGIAYRGRLSPPAFPMEAAFRSGVPELAAFAPKVPDEDDSDGVLSVETPTCEGRHRDVAAPHPQTRAVMPGRTIFPRFPTAMRIDLPFRTVTAEYHPAIRCRRDDILHVSDPPRQGHPQ